jgi:hypothetical protein
MEDYLFVALTAIIGIVIQFDVVKRWKYKWAIDIIQLAVAFVYNEFVKPLKEANGKLTIDQRVEARKQAIAKAKEIAAQRGIDLDVVLSDQLLEMFVQMAVSKAKKGNA